MNIKQYEQFMLRALELATKGWGSVSPNPMVGAVVLKNCKIVGEGFHEGPGKKHAEVVAIENAGKFAKGADLVVTLEPCCHFGRTPPCTNLIIKTGIKRIIYGIKDPNPIVSGNGIRALKVAGVEVVGPLLEDECSSLNRIYINWVKNKRPYVIAKVALSLDGKIAAAGGDSKWITGERCRQRMHYWRSGVDAVLIGGQTARVDDPLLDARGVGCRQQPRPVIITASGKLSPSLRLWNRSPAPIIVCKGGRFGDSLKKRGVDVIIPKLKKGLFSPKTILEGLGELGINSVLLEGGGNVHSGFIREGLTQYMIASMSAKLIGSSGREWLPDFKTRSISESPRIKPDQILVLDNDVVIEGEVVYSGR